MSEPDVPVQMKKGLSRRALLAGGGAAVVVVVVGGYTATRFLDADEFGFGGKSPDSEAAAYVKLLAEVHDDYVNGRVVQHDGWILSEHEFDTIDSRVRRPAPGATAVS